MLIAGKYEVYLSTVTLEEIADCPEPNRSELRKCLEQIKYTILKITDEVEAVANKIVEMGVLTQKSYDDCQHIAAAVVEECNCIVSWNFKHIVRIKTINGVRAIANLSGYKPIDILSPTVLLESEE